jgi:hypothetical protein
MPRCDQVSGARRSAVCLHSDVIDQSKGQSGRPANPLHCLASSRQCSTDDGAVQLCTLLARQPSACAVGQLIHSPAQHMHRQPMRTVMSNEQTLITGAYRTQCQLLTAPVIQHLGVAKQTLASAAPISAEQPYLIRQ